jgi:hypothetical protein
VRGWRRAWKNETTEAKAATYEEEVRDLRGVRWMYPRWITTRMYSWPWAERTGKRPVRSAEDHWSLCRVTEVLGKAMSASKQKWGDSKEKAVEGDSMGGSDTLTQGVKVAVGGSEGKRGEFANEFGS